MCIMNQNFSIPSQFRNRADFDLRLDQNILVHKNPSYTFYLRPSGYVPKSGLILRDYLLKQSGKIDTALEIGIGELAFIPISLIKHNKAQMIDSFEIDDVASEWAQKNISVNDLENSIKIYRKWSTVSDKKYDLIYSNPPQMPVMINKSFHDDGGRDGLQTIKRVITFAKDHLKTNGRLILLVFDFLNVEQQYNNRGTLMNILRNNSLKGVIRERFPVAIRLGGRTETQLGWIKKQYPLFDFNRDNNLGHSILVLEAKPS